MAKHKTTTINYCGYEYVVPASWTIYVDGFNITRHQQLHAALSSAPKTNPFATPRRVEDLPPHIRNRLVQVQFNPKEWTSLNKELRRRERKQYRRVVIKLVRMDADDVRGFLSPTTDVDTDDEQA